MTIYEHRATVVVASGSGTTHTLFIPGGLLNQVLIRMNTSDTLFAANLLDENGTTRLNFSFNRGELNEHALSFAVAGSYALRITNASPDDTATVVLSVEE